MFEFKIFHNYFVRNKFIFGGGGGGTLLRATPPKIQALSLQ
jgi:hypothetical protein